MNLDMLNEQQREAVLTTEGPLLITGTQTINTKIIYLQHTTNICFVQPNMRKFKKNLSYSFQYYIIKA
jgi:hypothetical protein